MTPRYILAGVLALGWVGFRIALIMIQQLLWNEVNDNLPPERRVPHCGPSYLRREVLRLHRVYYPNSRRRQQFYVVWWGNVLCLVAALACVVRID